VGLFSRKPKEPNKSKPDDLGMLWAETAAAKQVLKKGRERRPSYRWRCCRCGAGFVLPIEPEKVPVPWWYYEAIEAAGWKPTNKNPVPWSCPGCGTFSYTVPL
jgi:rubrerythrin